MHLNQPNQQCVNWFGRGLNMTDVHLQVKVSLSISLSNEVRGIVYSDEPKENKKTNNSAAVQ